MNRVSLQLPGFFAFGYFDFIIGIILNISIISIHFKLLVNNNHIRFCWFFDNPVTKGGS
jgi:hypothetical protein